MTPFVLVRSKKQYTTEAGGFFQVHENRPARNRCTTAVDSRFSAMIQSYLPRFFEGHFLSHVYENNGICEIWRYKRLFRTESFELCCVSCLMSSHGLRLIFLDPPASSSVNIRRGCHLWAGDSGHMWSSLMTWCQILVQIVAWWVEDGCTPDSRFCYRHYTNLGSRSQRKGMLLSRWYSAGLPKHASPVLLQDAKLPRLVSKLRNYY
jgi:hypothetical protein